MRINGQAKLACNTKLRRTPSRCDSQRAGTASGAITVEPMGNMPVLKDLIVNMDAVHWKKVQRVVPVAAARRAIRPSASTSCRRRR